MKKIATTAGKWFVEKPEPVAADNGNLRESYYKNSPSQNR
jgi:hypothetical protein